MKKCYYGLFLICFVCLGACTNVATTPLLSQMQLREITSKEIQADFKSTFKATMSILQDQDYIIQNTDFNSGLILAEKELTKEVSFGDMLTVLLVDPNYKRGGKIKISATVSEITSSVTKLRINIQEKKIETGRYGANENIRNIQNREVYDTLFHQIEVEAERLKATK